jgi:D-alanyl-D-alanine dipeptidase
MALNLGAAILMLAVLTSGAAAQPAARDLPDGFAFLADVAPEIEQDMRYHGSHNFVGRPIAGYDAGSCILARPAAEALAAAAAELAAAGLGLRVYDCYRPARAVADFAAWARDVDDRVMQDEFYPRVDKANLFDQGYIAERSGHSRGSTVDLALVVLGSGPISPWQPGQPLADCTLPLGDRFADGTLDFGTGYDCFDEKAHHGAAGINADASANRQTLAELMARHGFAAYAEEWWHYTLVNEPFPETYFDFPVQQR